MELAIGFEPMNNAFAERPLKPLEHANIFWGKRRGTIPQPPQSQCGILPIELLSPSIHPQPCVPLQLARGFSVLVHDLKGTRSGGKNWSRTNTLWFFRPALRPLKLSTHIRSGEAGF